MSFSHGKQPDRGKNIKDKLKKYKEIRQEDGESVSNILNQSDLLDIVVSDDESMKQVYEIVSHPEDIEKTINDVKENQELSVSPEAQQLIINTDRLANSIVELKEKTSEKLILYIREIVGDIVQGANYVYKELGDEDLDRHIQSQSFGNVHYAFSEITRNILSFTVAGTSCIHAYNKLDFHNWLEWALIKRTVFLNELFNLEKFNPTDNLNDIAYNIYKDMQKYRSFKKMDEKEINKLSPERYREILMEIFEMFTNAKLTAKDKEFVNKKIYDSINENNIQSIIALLEKSHIKQQLEKLEESIHTRLIVRLDDTKENKAETKRILGIYASIKESDELYRVVKATIDPENSDITDNEMNIEKSEEIKIKNKLIIEFDSATNELNARAFLLMAAALMLTIAILAIVAIACSTPGLGPVMVALAVVAIASIVIAYMIKPEIFTGMKKDVSHYMDKMLVQYNAWKTKDEIKDHHKMKSGLNSRESHAMFKNKMTSTDSVNASSSLVKSYDKK